MSEALKPLITWSPEKAHPAKISYTIDHVLFYLLTKPERCSLMRHEFIKPYCKVNRPQGLTTTRQKYRRVAPNLNKASSMETEYE